MRTRAPSGEAGFTLFELIVSMTLLGFIAVTLSFAIRFGVRAWERVDASVKSTDEAVRLETLLRDELPAAYPGFTGGPVDARLQFTGTSDRLEFLTWAPRALAPAGRARVTLATHNSTDGTEVVWTATPEVGNADAPPATEILLAHLSSFDLSYFGALADEPAGWHSRWVDAARLPLLIRVRAERRDRHAWPELVVAPRISANVGCRLDPLTRSCRGL